MHFQNVMTVLVLATLAFHWDVGQVAAQSDQIQMTGGARLEGTIVGASKTKVTIEIRGTKRDVNVNEIKHVTFTDEPSELRAGRARILAGKADSGLADLKKLDPAGIKSEVVRLDYQFYVALATGKVALSSGGDKGAAKDLMLAFVNASPQSFHFFEAAELLGDLSVAQGEFTEAVKYYGAISAQAPWPAYKMSAMMSEARALIAQKDFASAQKKYETVLQATSDTKQARREKLFAQIGKARCLAETGSVDEGIALIEEIIAKNDSSDTELFGRAYNAHGDCLQKAGKTKDALMAYLHVDLLFYSDSEIHAESLYHLTKLWAAIKNNDRSVAARKLLDQRYSGSIWAGKP